MLIGPKGEGFGVGFVPESGWEGAGGPFMEDKPAHGFFPGNDRVSSDHWSSLNFLVTARLAVTRKDCQENTMIQSMPRVRVELTTHGFSVRCSTN